MEIVLKEMVKIINEIDVSKSFVYLGRDRQQTDFKNYLYAVDIGKTFSYLNHTNLVYITLFSKDIGECYYLFINESGFKCIPTSFAPKLQREENTYNVDKLVYGISKQLCKTKKINFGNNLFELFV
jgi:hypothetical protein